MTADQPRVHKLGRVPSLDGVRGTAVLLVMGYHAGIGGFHGGRAGVDVFFVLSGFLITALLLEEHDGTDKIRLGAFYMRRVLRLYPALVAAVIVAIALAALKIPIFDAGSGSLRETLKATPFTLFYSMNIPRAMGTTGGGFLGHAWSLAIEERFYLVWPIVVILVLRRGGRMATLGWIALGCAVASSLSRTVLDLAGFGSEMLYNATFSHVDGIFAGCALAVAWSLRPATVSRFTHSVLTLVAVLVAGFVIVRGEQMNEYGFAVVVVATLVLVADLVSNRESRLSAAMSQPVLVEIGRRSYGLYLYHWPIFLFIGIDTRLHILALGFGASFAAAWLSFALLEQPFLRMKRRWSSQHHCPSVHPPELLRLDQRETGGRPEFGG